MALLEESHMIEFNLNSIKYGAIRCIRCFLILWMHIPLVLGFIESSTLISDPVTSQVLIKFTSFASALF